MFDALNIEYDEFYFFYEKGYLVDPTTDHSQSEIEIDDEFYRKGYLPLFEFGCGHQAVLIINGEGYGEMIDFGGMASFQNTNKNSGNLIWVG